MPRAARRDQLVAVAREMFVTQGFALASMDEVAERAGVTKPVLYDHFGSKDGLLAAVLEQAGHQLLAVTALAVAEARSPREVLERGVRAYFDNVDANTAAWVLLLREVSPGTAAAAAVEAVRQAQVDEIAVLVQAHLPGVGPVLAGVYAQVVSGAVERLGIVRLTQPALSADQATAALLDVLWQGLSSLAGGTLHDLPTLPTEPAEPAHENRPTKEQP